MSNINPAAKTAREKARQTDGRFGEQHKTDPGQLHLGPPPTYERSPATLRREFADFGFKEADHAWDLRDEDIQQAIDMEPDADHMFDTIEATNVDFNQLVEAMSAVQRIHTNAVTIAGSRRGPMHQDHRWGHNPHCEGCVDPTGRPHPLPPMRDPHYWEHQAAMCQARADRTPPNTQARWAWERQVARHTLQAQIARDGGRVRRKALFTTDGQLVPAKLIETRYGPSWGLLETPDPHSNLVGWVSPSRAATAAKRTANMASKGYREGWVWVRAKAETGAGAPGLEGRLGQAAYAVRTDDGFSYDIEFDGWDSDDEGAT